MSSVVGSNDVWMLLQVMNDVYSKFSQCQDNLPLARNEVYVCTLWGQWFFLPAISGLRSKRYGLSLVFRAWGSNPESLFFLPVISGL